MILFVDDTSGVLMLGPYVTTPSYPLQELVQGISIFTLNNENNSAMDELVEGTSTLTGLYQNVSLSADIEVAGYSVVTTEESTEETITIEIDMPSKIF